MCSIVEFRFVIMCCTVMSLLSNNVGFRGLVRVEGLRFCFRYLVTSSVVAIKGCRLFFRSERRTFQNDYQSAVRTLPHLYSDWWLCVHAVMEQVLAHTCNHMSMHVTVSCTFLGTRDGHLGMRWTVIERRWSGFLVAFLLPSSACRVLLQPQQR